MAYLLNPVPEPGTGAMLFISLMLLARNRRSRGANPPGGGAA
jgi:hypothetical protein